MPTTMLPGVTVCARVVECGLRQASASRAERAAFAIATDARVRYLWRLDKCPFEVFIQAAEWGHNKAVKEYFEAESKYDVAKAAADAAYERLLKKLT